jgi:phospholipase C
MKRSRKCRAPDSGVGWGSVLPVGMGLLVAVVSLGASLTANAARASGDLRPAAAPAPDLPFPSTLPISHFVFVVMENRAYDNYFASYCRALGTYCDSTTFGPNLSRCLPLDPWNASWGCHDLYAFPPSWLSGGFDLDHGYVASHVAYDHGRMDNFYLAEHKSNQTFGYYDGSLVPMYWDIAEQYGLGDDFFSSTLSYSLPNHWYMLAGAAPKASETNVFLKQPGVPLNAAETSYLDDSNHTTSIADLLAAHPSVSWKYYDWSPLASYTQAVNLGNWADETGSAWSFWNPLMAKSETYRSGFANHFVPRADFFNDAAKGALPNVAWVVPNWTFSDHPPANITMGQSFIAKVLDAVATSSDWNSTALFVLWDDYGGEYDNRAPPPSEVSNVSFRVPLLVVSPYTPEGYVGHQFAYFESLLHTIEWRFGLPSLNGRDAEAPLLLNYFDLNATPRPPFSEPISWSDVSYPQTFQPLPPPLGVTSFRATAGTNAVHLTWAPAAGGSPRAGWLVTYGPPADPSAHELRVDHIVTFATVTNLTGNASYVFSIRSFEGPSLSAASTTTIDPETTYPVMFNETGLPSGTSWSVDVNGSVQTSPGTPIVWPEANGTYPYRVDPVGEYTATPTGGTVTVDGASTGEAIHFAVASPPGVPGIPGNPGPPPPHASSAWSDVGLGVLIASAVVITTVPVLSWLQRKRAAPSPPAARNPKMPP